MPSKFSAVVIDHRPYGNTISSADIIHHATYDTEADVCKAVINVLSRYQVITHRGIKSLLHLKWLNEEKQHTSPFCYRRKNMRRKIDAIATRKQLRAFAAKYIAGFNYSWTYQIREI